MRNGILKQPSSYFISYITRFLDLFFILVSSYVAFYIYINNHLGLPTEYSQYREPVLLSLILTIVIFYLTGFYKAWRGIPFLNEVRALSVALGLVFLALIVASVITKTSIEYSRAWFGLWFASAWLMLTTYRGLLKFSLKWMRSSGFNQRSIVVVGTGEIAEKVISHILERPWAGFQIAGIFSESPTLGAKLPSQTLPYKGYDELEQFVEKENIEQIWLAMPLSEENRLKEILHSLRHCTADIRFIPDIFGFNLLNHSFTEVAGLPIVNLCVTPMDGFNRYIKAVEDWVLSFIILILASPLLFIIAIGVKLSSPGPIFYRQERISWNGKTFMMLKFRSMPVDAESGSGAVWAQHGEQRATKFGAFLRKTSIDELPQFFNVLRGEMSIVGPRPERPVFVEKFKEEIPDYMKKHLVKAGITGWAQINGWRGNTDLKKRIEYDLFYIENWSLWLDIKIIFLTLFKGLVHKNAY